MKAKRGRLSTWWQIRCLVVLDLEVLDLEVLDWGVLDWGVPDFAVEDSGVLGPEVPTPLNPMLRAQLLAGL